MMAGTRLVAVLAVVAAACGGALGVDEYFAGVEAAAVQFDRDGADLAGRYDAQLDEGIAALGSKYDLDDPDQVASLAADATSLGISTTVDLLRAREQSYRRFIAEMESLAPPGEAADAHDASLSALRAAVDALPATIAAVGGLEDVGELAAAVTVSPFGAAQERLGDACRELQRVADAAVVEVDLRCG